MCSHARYFKLWRNPVSCQRLLATDSEQRESQQVRFPRAAGPRWCVTQLVFDVADKAVQEFSTVQQRAGGAGQDQGSGAGGRESCRRRTGGTPRPHRRCGWCKIRCKRATDPISERPAVRRKKEPIYVRPSGPLDRGTCAGREITCNQRASRPAGTGKCCPMHSLIAPT